MAKIYLPSELLNKSCYQVNQNYIRVWDSININDNNIYYDVFINQDYQYKQDSLYLTESLQCDNINQYTDDIYYRLDLDKILVIFIILLIICLYFPYRIFSRMFGRWLKL